jgi:ribosome-associated protein
MGEGHLLMAASPKKRPTETLVPAAPTETTGPKMIDVVLQSLEDAKAEQIVAIDIAGKSSLADHMVVTTGRSNRHVSAVADQVVKALRDNGFSKPRIEGLPHADWVLVDGGDVIVHIFRPEVREFYNIEKMWQADFAADAH